MRTSFRISMLCVVITILLFSCSQSGNQAVWLGYSSTIGSDDPKIVSPGQTVELLGEISPDSSQTKVKFDGAEGWLESKYLFKDAKLGIVKHRIAVWYGTDPGQNAIDIYPFEFVVVHESDSGITTATMVRSGSVFKCFIPDTLISTHEDDVTFLKNFMALYASTARSDQTAGSIVRLIKTGAEADLVLARDECFTWQTKLDELPDGELEKFMNKLGIYLDKETGTAASISFNLDGQVRTGLSKLLNNDDQAEPYRDQVSGPRNAWMERVIENLPTYVGFEPSYRNEDASMQLLAFLAYRADRSPENIKLIWNRYKALIFESVNANLWDERYLGINSTLMMDAYNHLNSNGHFESLVAVNDQVDGKPRSEQLERFTAFMLPSVSATIANETNTIDPDIYSLWIHSFWARRYKEGNEEVVAGILRECIDHYRNAERIAVEDNVDERGDAYDAEYEESDDGDYGEGENESDESEYSGPYIPPVELPAVGTQLTLNCVYLGTASGDCGHIYFSCDKVGPGDFGDAEFSESMADADVQVWYNLRDSDTDAYTIELEVVKGKQCQGIDQSSWPEGPIPRILSFKKVNP